MKMLVAALSIAVIGFAPVASYAENGSTSLRSFKNESAKARVAGGYGNPIIAVPVAVVDTMKAAAGSVVTEVDSFATTRVLE